jgi:hypothetical protein
MDRVKINTSKLKNLRFDREHFSFTDKEQESMAIELDKLEKILTKKGQAIFSVSKYDDLFSGSLKIDTHNLFAYRKDFSVATLFYKLRLQLEKDILVANQKCINLNKNHLVPKIINKIKNTDLFPINLKRRLI